MSLRKTLAAALCMLAIAYAFRPAEPVAQQAPAPPDLFGPPQRRPAVPPVQSDGSVPYKKGADILSRVPLGTRAVRLVQHGSTPLRVAPPDGMPEWEFRTRNAAAVALIQVASRVGASTPTRDWVDSTVSALVLEVLKSDGAGELAANQTITWTEPGGEVVLAGVHVVAEKRWAVPLRVGATYYAFLGRDAEGRWQAPATEIYEVVDDGAESMVRSTRRARVEASALRLAVLASRQLPSVRQSGGRR